MRFGNPINLLSVQSQQPGIALGTITASGILTQIDTVVTLPSNVRAIALYSQTGQGGCTVRCLGNQSGNVYIPFTAFPRNGELCWRVEPADDTTITIRIGNIDTTVYPGGTVLATIVGLTDPGAVGVFSVPNMPPVFAIPPSSVIGTALAAGVGTTTMISAPTSPNTVQRRLWVCTLNLLVATAGVGSTAEIKGSVGSGTIVRLRGRANDAQSYIAVPLNGFLLGAGEGLQLVVAGVGATADATVIWDNAN